MNLESALILPRVSEDPRVEHGVHVRAVGVVLLEVLLVHVAPAHVVGTLEHFVAVEILVRRFREDGRSLARWSTLALLVHYQSHVSIISNFTVGTKLISNKVLRNSLRVR